MTRKSPDLAELVPLADRYRWIVGSRMLMTAVLLILPWAGAGGLAHPWLRWSAVGWLVATAAVAPLVRSSRPLLVTAFGVGLIGDGILLAAAGHRAGGLEDVIAALVILHIVATTLLGSFRTGVKIALWHSLLALLYYEARAAGLIATLPGSISLLAVYLSVVWLITFATATAAAVSERELRRRRYDSEVLRRFALELSEHHAPATVVTRLARFAYQELGAHRATVVAYPQHDDAHLATRAYGSTVDSDGVRIITDLTLEVGHDAVLRRAGDTPRTITTATLDQVANPGLGAVLTDPNNLVIIPFSLDQVTGLLVLQYRRRFSRRPSTRVERRAITAAEQAAHNAAIALGRSLLHERVREAAQRDGLTGLANRRTFDEALVAAVAGGGPTALIMIDLDKFKALNDLHGHQVGDDVLRTAATAISTACRDDDLPVRYGGEEFAVILRRATTSDGLVVAERIRSAVAAAHTPVRVTASLGVAATPEHADHVAGLLAAADAALYAAKRGGRNQVRAAQRITAPSVLAG